VKALVIHVFGHSFGMLVTSAILRQSNVLEQITLAYLKKQHPGYNYQCVGPMTIEEHDIHGNIGQSVISVEEIPII